MQYDWKQFGEDVRSYREIHKLGLRESARIHSINQSTWCRAEQGKPIEAPTLIFLCELMRRHPRAYATSTPRPTRKG